MRSSALPADLNLATALAGVAVILVLCSLVGILMRRIRQPVVIGEILAGIALGPSLLGLLPGNPTQFLFPTEVRPMLSAIAQTGLLLFVFMIGWKLEKNLLHRQRRTAVAVSLSSVVLSFALGAGLALLIHSDHATVGGKEVPSTALALFIGTAMSITAFPVLARILTDSRLIHTRIGALALASAAIDDVLAWCLLAVVSATVTARSGTDLVQIAALSAGYVAVMFLVVRPLLGVAVRRLTRSRAVSSLLIVLVSGVFLSAYASTWIGIHAIFGAFLLGVVMPRESVDALQMHLRGPLDTIGTLLLPAYFIVTGLTVDIGSLTARNYIELAAIIGVACAGKMIGATASARAFGIPWREAGTLALLMNTRGLTELIILNAGVGLGVLDPSLFTMMVIMALVTTALAGPFLPRTPRNVRGRPLRPGRKPPTGSDEACDENYGGDRLHYRPGPAIHECREPSTS